MDKIYQVFYIAAYNFRGWRKNPKIILAFVLAFVLCVLLTGRAIQFANSYGTTMQIAEAFIWAFGNANSIMLSSMLLLFFFADMPFINHTTPYYLIRTKRSLWIRGQIVYIIIATVIYMTFLLVVSSLLCAPISFIGNMWSETGALLGYSGVGSKIALPASVKTMEMSLPYECMIAIFLLILGYSLFSVTLMMVFHLKKSKFLGIGSVFFLNIVGVVMDPIVIGRMLEISPNLQYRVNVFVGWLSPLNHATYYMHNFGYDLLPRIWHSLAIFSLLILINLCIIRKKVNQYEFDFKLAS